MIVSKSKIIIAEGNDEVVFLNAICEKFNFDCQIIDAKGVERIPGVLSALLQDDNFSIVSGLAIIRDADNNQQGALDGIKHHLRKNNLPIPKKHADFQSDGKINVGIFIAPGKDIETGMLETLISRSLQHHPAHIKAESYITSLNETLRPKVPDAIFDAPKNFHKARLYATFAGMKKSPNTIKLAIEQSCIDLSDSTFDELKDFISKI